MDELKKTRSLKNTPKTKLADRENQKAPQWLPAGGTNSRNTLVVFNNMKSKSQAKENLEAVSKKLLTTVESRKSDTKLKKRTGTPHLATATRRPKPNFDQTKKEEDSLSYGTTPRISFREQKKSLERLT
jgi:hypothetical protein